MSRTRVCSGFNPEGRLLYGERFLASFDRHWPRSVELQVYVEEEMEMPRGACRMLWDIPGAREFHDRHADNLAAQGREPTKRWKPREIAAGYSFRTDAYKFWKQMMIPGAAREGLADGDILIWLDGDVETIAQIPPDFPERMLADAQISYLGRQRYHSEIGFWAVRIGRKTSAFLQSIGDIYRSDRVFKLGEWHSAFAWDHCRRIADLAERNLTPRVAKGHVWPLSPLAPYMRHDKGKRKFRRAK